MYLEVVINTLGLFFPVAHFKPVDETALVRDLQLKNQRSEHYIAKANEK